MRSVLVQVDRIFDPLVNRWRSHEAQRALGSLLVALFIGALAVIELNRRGLLPSAISTRLTTSHFGAVTLTLTVLLILSIFSLIFDLPRSVSDSMGRQFEALSLIFLRGAFGEFAHFGEPIQWRLVAPSIPKVMGDMVGGLLSFVLVGVYYRVQRHRPITSHIEDLTSFVSAKKVLALVLLTTFAALCADGVWREATGGEARGLFGTFFTILIFSDVLIVLISLRYSSEYRVVFRNTGFAVATVMIRLTLTAPPPTNLLLGLGAAGFAVALSLAYNAFGAGQPELQPK